MPVKEVSDGGLKGELQRAGDKLVLVDFFATWCGPCKMVAPAIDKLSSSYPNAVFLKVDVDRCQTEAQDYRIEAMPTFVFIRQSKELERIRGADTHAIESALVKYYKQTSAFGGEGHSMLNSNSKTASSATNNLDGDRNRLEQLAQERFGNLNEGQTLTTIRLRLPDTANPVSIRLGTDRTLNDIRQLLRETIPAFKAGSFEFMVPPAMKIRLDEEKKTIQDARLTNAVLTVKKI